MSPTDTTPEVVVFLDDIADKPPVIDEGKLVKIEVTEAKVRFGRESGEPYIELREVVVDDEEDEGAPMTDRLPLPLAAKQGETPKAYKKRMDRRCYRLKQAAMAFMVNTSAKRKPDELAEAFISRRAWCRTRLEENLRGNSESRPDAYYKENEKPEEEKK